MRFSTSQAHFSFLGLIYISVCIRCHVLSKSSDLNL
uniref:Uncharacterized protein n=1 Tax=Anguilla anguilla TaxID=7936 RepID=A0A0E9WJH6_ANGAN